MTSFSIVPSLLIRLDARDRALFQRVLLVQGATFRTRVTWTALTHVGGARFCIAAVLLPLLLIFPEAWREAGAVGAWTLGLSHLLVQIAKRLASRPRPTALETAHWHVAVPDQFSFPSGHACAAMSVAFGYAHAFPGFAIPFVILAMLVGASRVRLGVHYPGDVLAGQVLALITGLAVVWVR